MERKISLKNVSRQEKNKWKKEKEKEWQKNANFWIKIIQEKLDPYRLKITNQAVLKFFKKGQKKKILDAGCGNGYLSRILAKRGFQVYAIDFCSELIESAKKQEKKNPLGINYILGDLRKTKLPSSSFEAVLSHQTINEIENPEKAFQEFSRILKKNGQLVLLFLHPCFETQPEKYFQESKIKKSHYLVSGIKSPSPYFYLHLPLSQWSYFLEKNGFIIKKIEEPCPSAKLLKKKWWKNNFKKPLFILIEATKK
jgi:2-polyprenyl-3-methyl-5-hydroxy-6-metoxy-1,4-benzoquinol methylase